MIKQHRILVVDDDVDFMDLIVDYLEEEGFSTLKAENGDVALKHIRQGKPDLILLDILLAKENGLDVCRTLKAHPSTSDIPIIFVSCSNSLSDMLSSYLCGAWRYLSKPFALGELGECIHNVLYQQERNDRQPVDMFSRDLMQGNG